MRIRRPVLTAALGTGLAALALAAAPAPPKHLDRALAAQQALVATAPGDAAAHNDLGNLLALAGDRRAAEEAFRRSLELDSESPAAHFNYGLLLARTGRRAAALRQFRAVVERDPGNAWAHYQIGQLYEGWGMDRFARRAYTRAFRLDPGLADARVNPDVIGNRQATVAMLEAWSGGIHGSSAPSLYSDGGRIAGLLIDYPEPGSEAAQHDAWSESDDAEAGETGESSGGFARLARPGTSPVPRDDGGGESGAWNSELAEKEAAAGEYGYDDGAEGTRLLTPEDLSGSTVNQVSPGASPSPTRVVPSTPRSRSRPTRGGFLPGRDSTGRLELRLAPPAGDDPALATIAAIAG